MKFSRTVVGSSPGSICITRSSELQPSNSAETTCSRASNRTDVPLIVFPSTEISTSSASKPSGTFILNFTSAVKYPAISLAIFSQTFAISSLAGSQLLLLTTLSLDAFMFTTPSNAISTFPSKSRTFPTYGWEIFFRTTLVPTLSIGIVHYHPIGNSVWWGGVRRCGGFGAGRLCANARVVSCASRRRTYARAR